MFKIGFVVVLMFIVSMSIVSASLTDGAIFYWSFNPNGNLTDSVNGTDFGNATSSGSGIGIGIINNSRTITAGTNNKVTTTGAITRPDALTFNFWVNLSANTTNTFMYGEPGSGSFGERYLQISGSRILWTIGNGAGGSSTLAYDFQGIKTNNWYMITLMANATNLSIYVNGTLVNSSVGSYTITSASSGGIGVGRAWDSGTSSAAGSYDEVGYWSRRLNTSEVLSLWNASAGFTYPFINFSAIPLFSISATETYLNNSVSSFSANVSTYDLSNITYSIDTIFNWTTSGNVNLINTSAGGEDIQLNSQFIGSGGSMTTDITIPQVRSRLYLPSSGSGGWTASVLVDGQTIYTAPFSNFLPSFIDINQSINNNITIQCNVGGVGSCNIEFTTNNPTIVPYDITQTLSYSTTNGTIITDIASNSTLPLNVTVFNPTTYLPSYYSLANAGTNLAARLNQTKINLTFIDSVTNEVITSPITMQDTTSNLSYINITGGSIVINPPSGSRDFTFTSDINGLSVGLFSFSNLEISTQNVYFYPSYNFTFYNEATNAPLNLSRLESLLFYTQCANSSSFVNVTTQTVVVSSGCPVVTYQAFAKYPGESTYLRSILPYNLSVNGSGDSFKVYMIDLTENQGVTQSFSIDDLFSQYQNPSMIIYKVIGNSTVQIHGDYFDIEQKVAATLIYANLYSVVLFSDNNPPRLMGAYSADDAGQKSMRVYDIGTGGGTNVGFDNVSVIAGIFNISGSQFFLANYSDPTNLTTSVVFTMLANASTVEQGGIVITSATFTNNSFSIQQNITQFNSSYIYVYFEIHYGGQVYKQGGLFYQPRINLRPGLFDNINQQTINWFILIPLAILGIYATRRTHDLVAVFISLIALLLSTWNWLAFGNSTVWTGVSITGLMAIMLMISIINLFRSKADRGYM